MSLRAILITKAQAVQLGFAHAFALECGSANTLNISKLSRPQPSYGNEWCDRDKAGRVQAAPA
jgi:hypothetical protein